ncbi:Poly(A) polymerase [Teratosphaeria nubilosa]|uniref:Poly(A) polymerase n=1 Tax=Teratosphaeria nubilosa TaxID=161662 RepID=A0A6G1LAU0_9PEZI|nr:Poly(A) polymerase [Teratosphaeria nubilosa]
MAKQPQPEQWGVTSPFSLDKPSSQDMKLDQSLTAELKRNNVFAPQNEIDLREELCNTLERLLKEMVQTVGKKKGLPQSLLDDAGGKLFPYGSYKLGVHSPGSDIDALMAAPKHVTKDDFFEHMPDLLRGSCTPAELGKLVAVPSINVPIIKLEMKGVEIDLIFVSLQVQSVPSTTELTDDSLLRGLTETDVRSANGPRVAARLLELVPQVKTFRVTLRAIKLWAGRRGIYGNTYGYPGGVAYAILVARVCQLYPYAAAPMIVRKFFWVMKNWGWPKPLFIQKKVESSLGFREFDPTISRADAAHMMPILTPAYPRNNSAHTVGPSTKAIIMRELARGSEIAEEIYTGKKQWKDLFAKHVFFTESYKHYIFVTSTGKTKDAAAEFAGRVQSRVRWLVKGIEESNANSVELVQPYFKAVDREHEVHNQEDFDKVLDGSLDFQVKATKTTDIDKTLHEKVEEAAQISDEGATGKTVATNGDTSTAATWPQKMYTCTIYLGIALRKNVGGLALDISAPVRNFQTDVQAWDKYDEALHKMTIKHARNFNLPDDLFGEGETKPSAPKKKIKAPNNAAPNNKRSLAEAGLDVCHDRSEKRFCS